MPKEPGGGAEDSGFLAAVVIQAVAVVIQAVRAAGIRAVATQAVQAAAIRVEAVIRAAEVTRMTTVAAEARDR